MTITQNILLLTVALLSYSAAYNAREAHRHMHEIACHVGAADLCKYHGEQK